MLAIDIFCILEGGGEEVEEWCLNDCQCTNLCMCRCEALWGRVRQWGSVGPSPHQSIIITKGRSVPVCRPAQPTTAGAGQAARLPPPASLHSSSASHWSTGGGGAGRDKWTNDAWSVRLTMRCLLGLCFAWIVRHSETLVASETCESHCEHSETCSLQSDLST